MKKSVDRHGNLQCKWSNFGSLSPSNYTYAVKPSNGNLAYLCGIPASPKVLYNEIGAPGGNRTRMTSFARAYLCHSVTGARKERGELSGSPCLVAGGALIW